MSVAAGRGAPYANDGFFMNETCPEANRSADLEASLWSKRRDMLAEHREYCKAIKGK
jgi:hypothetical protein